jgi:hypothetical protein
MTPGLESLCWLTPLDIARRWDVELLVVFALIECGRLPGHRDHRLLWIVSRASVVRFEQSSMRLGIRLERYHY